MMSTFIRGAFITGLAAFNWALAAPVTAPVNPPPFSSVNLPPLTGAGNGGIDMFTGSPSPDYKSYLNFTGVGTQTLQIEKSLGKFAPFMYLAGNEALEAQQLENLIGDQMKIMSQLGIMIMPTWESVDTRTTDLFVNNRAPIYGALIAAQGSESDYMSPIAAQGSESDGKPISATSIQMDTYIANLVVMASQNEAVIMARLQSCMSQGSLKQCGSTQS